MMMMTSRSTMLMTLLLGVVAVSSAFQGAPVSRSAAAAASSSKLFAKAGYEPKWKKKETIGGTDLDDASKGLVGNIPVTFTQGNVTKTTMAIAGQPLSDVATQAGQFIRYACKKGECGTCECMADGKWVRPCVDKVPASQLSGQPLLISIKAIRAATTSSGKFYSVKSFFMGFYNNLLGMIGFVKMRREAKKNFADRLEYEDLIRNLTLQKRAERMIQQQEEEFQAAHRKPYQPEPVLVHELNKLPSKLPSAIGSGSSSSASSSGGGGTATATKTEIKTTTTTTLRP